MRPTSSEALNPALEGGTCVCWVMLLLLCQRQFYRINFGGCGQQDQSKSQIQIQGNWGIIDWAVLLICCQNSQ